MNYLKPYLQPFVQPFSSLPSWADGGGGVGVVPQFIGPDFTGGSTQDGTAWNSDESSRFEGSALVYSFIGVWPAAMSIDPATCVVSGTWTPVASYSGLGIRATNELGSADSNLFSVEVTAIPAPPLFDGVVPDITEVIGVAIAPYDSSAHFTTGGLVASYTLNGVANGLTIDTVTGLITGSLTAEQVNALTVTATNVDGSADSNSFNATGEALPLDPPIFDGEIPDIVGAVGAAITPYDASVHFQTGGTVDSWALSGVTNALTIDAAGVISGVPTETSFGNMLVIATNADGSDNSNLFLLTVVEAGTPVTAKSVVFDIADNWGNSSIIGVRSIDFMLDGVKLSMLDADFTGYATSENSAASAAHWAFDTVTLKVGTSTNTSWFSLSGFNSNQRLIIVFNSEQTFDEIVINNFHNSGGYTNYGAQNVVITASDDAITDTTYNAPIANSTVLSPVAVFLEHVATNTEDPQTVWTF